MKTNLVLAAGLILALLGLAILSDTLLVREAAAIPVPIGPCSCHTPAGDTKRCGNLATYAVCDSLAMGQCNLYAIGGATAETELPILFSAQSIIPDGCMSANGRKVNCGTESIECYRRTRCKWVAEGTGRCIVDPMSPMVGVQSADRRKEEACDAGAVCPDGAG